MPSKHVIDCSKALAEQNLTIAFAESATAGRMASEFSLVPDSGKILKGGLVCYDACIKEDILGVPHQLVEQYTPESAEVTAELVKRLSSFIKADIHVAITGLTTAGGSETAEKPVGTIFIHALIKGRPVSTRQVFAGTNIGIIMQAIDQTALLILQELDVAVY